jgi:hypothetical protein
VTSEEDPKGGVVCRQCGFPKHWSEFLDEDRRLSTRCQTCRDGAVTGPQTPYSRKASGLIPKYVEEQILREKDAEADTLPPPPDDEAEDGER